MDKINSFLNKEVYIKSLVYAKRKINKFQYFNVEAEDIVHAALEKVISGKREWNPEKYPDIFVHLAGCIRSEISNVYRSYDNRLVEKGTESSINIINNFIDDSRSPELELEIESRIKYIVNYISERRGDLVDVARAMYENGNLDPSEISNALGITVKDASLKKLAIKRILKKNDFIINYISSNRNELSEMAAAIYKRKIQKNNELCEILGVGIDEARSMREELLTLTSELRQGII